MTYSIDVINLCFHHLHSNKTKKTVAKILEISINTINYWVSKYYSNYINKEPITNQTIIEYKKNNIHKSSKRHLYSDRITEYVNSNKGESLDNIREKATDNCLSKSTVCRALKELKISYKKINNYLVCKDINIIEQDRKNYSTINSKNIDKFNNCISIDESGFNIDDIVNKGYSQLGSRIIRTKFYV